MKRWKWGVGTLAVWLIAMLAIGGAARANGALGLYPSAAYLAVLALVLLVCYFAKQRILLFLMMLYGGSLTVLAGFNFLQIADTFERDTVWAGRLTGLFVAPLAGLYEVCEMLTDHLAVEMFWIGCALGGVLLVLVSIAAFVPVCTRIGKEKDEARELAEEERRARAEAEASVRIAEMEKQLSVEPAPLSEAAASGFPAAGEYVEPLRTPDETLSESGFPRAGVPRDRR